MNIFTRFLSQFSADEPLHEFVARWDQLEVLVVRVYRQGRAGPADEALFEEANGWLKRHYDRWAAPLAPFWQKSKVGGTLEHTDPFLMLMSHRQAADFVDNWAAMQHLPAAREALNEFIVARTGEA